MSSDCNAVTHVRRSDVAVRALPPHRKRPEASEYARLPNRPEWRLDGLLPWHWWGYEADGALKYDNRADASKIIRAQQEREFRLRRLGLDLLRYGWPDAYPSREPLENNIRAMFSDNLLQAEPVKWWMDVPGHGPVEPGLEGHR